MAKKKPESKVVELSLLHDKAMRKWAPIHKALEENGRYRRADHYSEKETKKINEDGRRTFSLGLVEAKGNTLVSQFIMSPYEFRVRARNKESEITAEIENAIFRYEYDVNDMQYEFSDWYQKGLFYKYGVIAREIDYTKNPEGEIVVKNLLPQQCLWDTNCKEYNVSRYAQFFQDWDYPTREQLKMDYDLDDNKVMSLPKARIFMDNNSIKYENWLRGDEEKDNVKRIRHFEREFRVEYECTYNDGSTNYHSKKVVVDEENAKKTSEQQAADSLAGNIYVVNCKRIVTEWIVRIDFCPLVNEVLYKEEKRTEHIPRHVYSGMMEDGNLLCLTDIVKPTARMIDRVATQIDSSLAKMIKNSYEVDWDNIEKEDQDRWKKLSKELVTGGAIVRKRKGFQGRVIQPIDGGHGPPPALFTTFQYWVSALEDMMGGRNAQGLKERNASNESGVLFEKRLEAGFAMAYIFIYNFGRSMKNLGEGLHEDIQEVYGGSEERVLEITDSDLDEEVRKIFESKGIYTSSETRKGEGYLNLGKEHLDFGKARVRIIIDKGNYTPSAKEKKFNMWTVINNMRIKAGQRPYPFSYYADSADIDATVLAKMKQFDDKMDAMEADQMKMKQMETVFNAQDKGMQNLQSAYKDLNEMGQQKQEASSVINNQ